MHSGPSYFAELTIDETSWASIRSAGSGFNSDRALAKAVRDASSHCSSSSGRRITGILVGRESGVGRSSEHEVIALIRKFVEAGFIERPRLHEVLRKHVFGN